MSAACGGTARAEGCRETTHSATLYHINSATQRDDATQRGDSTADDDKKGGAAALDSRYHAVWVDFFCECWMAGAPIETAAQLRDALQISRKHPLDKQTVVKLGVRVEAMRLLVELAPAHAIPLYGFTILEHEAAVPRTEGARTEGATEEATGGATEEPFARSVSEEHLLRIRELTPAGLREDQNWAVCRYAIGQVAPPSALRLSIALVCASRELSDLALVGSAFRAVDGFTRKQVWLPKELGALWRHRVSAPAVQPAVYFGDKVLEMLKQVALETAPDEIMQGIVG